VTNGEAAKLKQLQAVRSFFTIWAVFGLVMACGGVWVIAVEPVTQYWGALLPIGLGWCASGSVARRKGSQALDRVQARADARAERP